MVGTALGMLVGVALIVPHTCPINDKVPQCGTGTAIGVKVGGKVG